MHHLKNTMKNIIELIFSLIVRSVKGGILNGVNASPKSKNKIPGQILKCPRCDFNINLTDEKNLTYIDVKEHTGFDSNKKKLGQCLF